MQDDDSVDIGAWPEMLRLAQEVRATGRPRKLQYTGETLAVVVPLRSLTGRRLRIRALTPRALEEFRSAAGSWSDIDVDRFLDEVYGARDVPEERPPVAF